jgi:hypothetical protein
MPRDEVTGDEVESTDLGPTAILGLQQGARSAWGIAPTSWLCSAISIAVNQGV